MVQILEDTMKTKIEEAGLKLFGELGYRQCTMGKIAEEAGISVGNIYKYYSSKEELFYKLIEPEFFIVDPAPASGARNLEGCVQAEP